jgi:putative DNA primase/helicase
MEGIEEADSFCNSIDRPVEIERLASLDPIDYEVARKAAADRLGIRASVLDDLRNQKRRELKLDSAKGDDGQGRTLALPEVMPWPDPIDGDRVAEALKATIKRYIRMSDAEADVCALWVLLSWAIDKFSKAPRLAITSPTKGCGKTTLLTLLSKLCRKPLRSGSTTPSVLFRVIEILHPTFLLDESEKFLEIGSEFHALLNQGHARGDFALRNVGDSHEPRMFDTFCLAAFARNGRIPDDLEQRSIIIELQRRLPGERLDVLRDDRADDLNNLARMCSRWSDDYVDDISGIEPDMGCLINRTADNWRPLFTIADLIGLDWPARIREVARIMIGTEPDSDDSVLLADIKIGFEAKDVDRLSSEEICEALIATEGRPWAEYGKTGKPISKNQLAKRLKRFKIVPDTIRIGGTTAKGYYRRQFQEAWDRYLSSTPQESPSETSQRRSSGHFSCVPKRNRKSRVTFRKQREAPVKCALLRCYG